MATTFAKRAAFALSSLAACAVLFAAAVSGCSAGVAQVGNGTDGGGADGTTPPPDGAVIPPNNPACPTAVPPEGTSCKPPASCVYQSGPHGSCTVSASCSSSSGTGAFMWTVTKPGPTCGGNKPACPATYTSLPINAACPGPSDTLCDYPEGRCGCTPCTPDGGSPQSSSEWICRKWTDVPAGCPTDVPTIGQPCTQAGLNCNYSQLCGGISFGGSFTCDGMMWTQGPVVAGSCALRTCGM